MWGCPLANWTNLCRCDRPSVFEFENSPPAKCFLFLSSSSQTPIEKINKAWHIITLMVPMDPKQIWTSDKDLSTRTCKWSILLNDSQWNKKAGICLFCIFCFQFPSQFQCRRKILRKTFYSLRESLKQRCYPSEASYRVSSQSLKETHVLSPSKSGVDCKAIALQSWYCANYWLNCSKSFNLLTAYWIWGSNDYF